MFNLARSCYTSRMTFCMPCLGASQRVSRLVVRCGIVFGAFLCAAGSLYSADLGAFENEADIGNPAKPGRVVFDSAAASYAISGGGENMWFANDSFHFVWKRVSGDFDLHSIIDWRGTRGNAHRKACLMVRQSLAADSAYVDVAVHGDGLTSLQFRESPGGLTHEIQANVSRPERVGIGRQGEVFFLSIPDASGTSFAPAGPFIRVNFSDPVYVGLGVCSHDDKVVEIATFSQVKLSLRDALAQQKPILHSTIEIVPIGSKDRRVLYHTLDHIEAPNWSRDGQTLIFNSGGHLYRIPAKG
ncbi:MAG TPA: hypothetical protein VL793_09570, partial [Patescibacteria group bacterium]|nr:hypothetical protein [Patescibacteria group bacterium]